MPDARRHGRIDALRGIAVFGILLVNVWSFVYGYTTLRYGVAGADASLADRAAIFFVASFAEQKFYPIFAFLFGASFALHTGRQRQQGMPVALIQQAYGRRLRALLGMGLLHGTLVWFGDILTTYALGGCYLYAKVGQRLSRWVGALRALAWWNALVWLVLLVASIAIDADDVQARSQLLQQVAAAHAVYTQGSWGAAALARVDDFATNLAGLVVFMPRIMLLFVAGVLAVRCGWLTRPQRYRAQWRRALWLGIGLGLPLNIGWGIFATWYAMHPLAPPPLLIASASALIDLAGPLLALAYVAAIMLASGKLAVRMGDWLATAGRLALTNYLMQSLLLMSLLQGFTLGWGAWITRAQMLGVCAAIVVAQLTLSRWWLAHHRQGPAEALWRASASLSRRAE